MATTGFVSLVGSGPGDPELLTIKALRLIEQADVVVFDRLVSAEILDLIPPGISQISVGKSPGKHCVQDEVTLASNLYLRGHTNKLTADISRINLKNDLTGKDEDVRFRLQWDVSF